MIWLPDAGGISFDVLANKRSVAASFDYDWVVSILVLSSFLLLLEAFFA